jgi:hemerythrin-like domain-containing protein
MARQYLFLALEAAGIPREGGPAGLIMAEHDRGRDCVWRMRAAVDKYRLYEIYA